MSIRQRVAIGAAASVVVIGAGIGLYAAQSPGNAVTEIQVEDTAGILHEPDLRTGIEQLRFYEPTTVAVFTHRGGPEALTDDFALNDAVLAYARETRTDWLSADEQKWADDLFIFAVDPEGRLVGTYFGENRAVSEATQLDIQDATRDELRRGQWTAGAVIGVEAAADRMNRPWARGPGGVVLSVGAALATLIGAGVYIGVGSSRARRSREARAAGDRSMAAVVRDYEETQIHAHLIPAESRYGGVILSRYEDYTAGFRELTEMGNQARGIPERKYPTREALATLTAYQEKAQELDHLDDVIADTAALLNRDQSWPQAWERQVAPLREDLQGTEELLTRTLPETARGLPEAQAVRELSSQALADLDQLRGDLEHQRISADDALDRLRTIRDELSGALDALAAAVARDVGAKESEQQLMEEALRKERSRRVSEPTILSTADPTWTWFSIRSFGLGYSAGTSQVEQSRSSSSSSGSTSGYSSGGSFSGSGSSSRF